MAFVGDIALMIYDSHMPLVPIAPNQVSLLRSFEIHPDELSSFPLRKSNH
jgi:hypothetical protein